MVNQKDEGETEQVSLKSQHEKHSFQGPDPLGDERIGLRYFVRFGGKGISPFPAFVAEFLRSNIYPLLINETETDCVFCDRLLLWTTTQFPVWIYLLLFADYNSSLSAKIGFGLCYVFYFAIWFDQFVSYVLALHCVVHRPIFKTNNAVSRGLKWFFVWIIGPMQGETPETYAAHHVSMHHPMNNGYNDLSTTLTYQRDSVWDFIRYLGRFLVVHVELYQDLSKRNPIVCQKFVTGEICWLSVGLVLYFFRPFPAALLYFLPVLVLRCGMTAGNWGQHSFLNSENPFINTNQSVTLVNTMYNTIAFNDGYHIQHHEYPIAPYYDLPLLFVKDLPELAKHDSVVFDAKGGFGAIFDWVGIWWLLMNDRYDVLADHFVDCKALLNKTTPRSKEEIIELLKKRTKQVYNEKTTPSPVSKK